MIHHRGRPLPEKLTGRILAMCRTGEDPAPLFAFWRRLADNPSQDSVRQLYDFLENKGIPISTDGMILAYKSVRPNFRDHHSGIIDNSVGQAPRMPRAEVCADPATHCAPGLHVGSLQYAITFGSSVSKIVICEVDPADVVSRKPASSGSYDRSGQPRGGYALGARDAVYRHGSKGRSRH